MSTELTGGPYDVLYQEWLTAHKAGDYQQADSIRRDFERMHGLTIFAEGPCVIEEVTAKRMKASTWYKQYDNPEVGRLIAEQDSKVTRLFPNYRESGMY